MPRPRRRFRGNNPNLCTKRLIRKIRKNTKQYIRRKCRSHGRNKGCGRYLHTQRIIINNLPGPKNLLPALLPAAMNNMRYGPERQPLLLTNIIINRCARIIPEQTQPLLRRHKKSTAKRPARSVNIPLIKKITNLAACPKTIITAPDRNQRIQRKRAVIFQHVNPVTAARPQRTGHFPQTPDNIWYVIQKILLVVDKSGKSVHITHPGGRLLHCIHPLGFLKLGFKTLGDSVPQTPCELLKKFDKTFNVKSFLLLFFKKEGGCGLQAHGFHLFHGFHFLLNINS